ncbi:MAG: NAD(P)-binding protein [bacterium]|nr:NAD(P)-binding protein [bacterium]
MDKKIVILGAGPTGLGAGYRLQELGYRNFTIYDRNPYVGGLATSFTDDHGFTYDIGGHVMFSHYPYFDALVDKLLGDDFTEIMREAWVWMMDRFVPYPFQNNIRYLPPDVVLECVLGLIEAQRQPEKLGQARNFDQLIDAQFGKGIASIFMKPYNFKVWAHPVDHMSVDWLGERVSLPNLQQILSNVILGQDSVSWGPNNRFKYPLYGGTGGLYTPFMRYVADHVQLNRNVVAVDPQRKQITFSDGEIVGYDLLLSTMPLDLLIGQIADAPDAVREQTHHLHHSSGLIVGVGVNRPVETSKCWLYFPETSAPFYRVTYLNNYSPYITPNPDTHLLLTETSYSPHKYEDKATIIDRVIEGLHNVRLLNDGDRDRIASTYLIDVDYSYPVPTTDRNYALGTIQPWLMAHDIYSRGRFGAWEYEIGNMDHSVMQGVELVNHWLLGEAETTWKNFAHVAERPVNIETQAREGDPFYAMPGHGWVRPGVNYAAANGHAAETAPVTATAAAD